MAKIIIADDHQMFRESLRKMLTTEKVAEVLAEASNGEELLELLEQHQPDLILMDISMPKMDGIEATKKALNKYHELKILALSAFDDEKYYYSMVEAGVKGFLLKNASILELQNAIKEVCSGNCWFSTNLLQKVIASLNDKSNKNIATELTERELEILKLVCESFTNEQIAEKLNISYDTVKWHRANLLTKTGCSNSAGLVLFAIRNKIIEI